MGYKAALKGKVLELSLGFSHPINYDIPEGIEITVDKNNVIIKGSDKQVVGQVAVKFVNLDHLSHIKEKALSILMNALSAKLVRHLKSKDRQ